MHEDDKSHEELKKNIERFEAMQAEGKFLYLGAEEYIEIVEWYLEEDRLTEAFYLIEKALEIHPENTSLILTYTTILIDEDRLKEAREMLNQLLPEETLETQLVNAELLKAEGKEEEAGDIIDALSVQSWNDMEYVSIANLCINIHFYERAVYWAKKAIKLDPNNDSALTALAESYKELGKFEKSIEIYNHLLDKDPYSPVYWTAIGHAYFSLGQAEKAIEACDFAIVADEDFSDAHFAKGQILFQSGAYESAIEEYQATLKTGIPDEEGIPLLISYCYIQLENWEQAYKYIEYEKQHMHSITEDNVACFMSAAFCLRMMGKYEEAHKELEYVIDSLPEYMEAYLRKGHYYLEEENRHNEALKCFNSALDINPTADTWNTIGDIALECKAYDIAKHAFTNLLEIDYGYIDAHKKLNQILTLEEVEESLYDADQDAVKYYMEILKDVIANGITTRYDIEHYINRALSEGYSPEELDKMKDTIQKMNKIIDLLNEEGEDE